MKKKTYIKCDLIIVDIQSEATLLAGSATSFREEVSNADQLSRQSSFDLWDDEDEEY